MSKRSRTRTSAPARTKAPPKERDGAGTGGSNGRRQVGSRSFTRRAGTAQRASAATRRPQGASTLLGLASGLPSLSLEGIRHRIPRAALVCALVACLNAVCWAIVTPPFEVPDEPDHFAYVKQLADTGSLPTSSGEKTAEEELEAMIGLRYYQVRQQPENHTIASHAEQEELERGMAEGPHESGSPAVGVARSQPPLYYALEAIPYSLAKSATVLDRLQLMRLLSALFAGLTALFAFLFLREALPGAPWAWTVGGLSVALMPLLGFMSGAVNPDAMLFAVSTATFYALARAFRRGLSMGGAVAIGAVTAIGLATKLNFFALVPGVLLGLLFLAVKASRRAGTTAGRLDVLRMLAVGLVIAVSPLLLYAAINVAAGKSSLGLVSNALTYALHPRAGWLARDDYIWQLYLPKLPGTANDFPDVSTTLQLWFDRYVGFYGWLDTTFPGWVDDLALIPAVAIVLLCGRALVQGRAALLRRAPELAVYAVMAGGLMVLLGSISYKIFPSIDAEYAQPRYLLPLIALVGAILALAARGAGRRWGPVVGTLIVVLFLAHDVLSQMLVAGRFYV